MSISEDIKELERLSWRMGELFERYQGKGWPHKEGDLFCTLRDEKVPALRDSIISKHADELEAAREARDSFEGSFLAADSALTRSEARLSKAIELLRFVAKNGADCIFVGDGGKVGTMRDRINAFLSQDSQT